MTSLRIWLTWAVLLSWSGLVAADPVSIGGVTPGMSATQVQKLRSQPERRWTHSQHDYIVYNYQPLAAGEETWIYEKDEVTLVLVDSIVRIVRGPTLSFEGRTYQGQDWPQIKARVTSLGPGLKVGYTQAPKARGYSVSNLTPAERKTRNALFVKVSGKHHLDASGDVFRSAPGQQCQTCKELWGR